MGRQRVLAVLSDEQFERAVAKLRIKPRSVDMARSVTVYGESMTDVAKRYGITKQTVSGIVQRVIKASGIYMASSREIPNGGGEPCVMCNAARFRKCRYELLACRAFVSYVKDGRFHDPTGCRPTAAAYDMLFPETEVARTRKMIRAESRSKDKRPQIIEEGQEKLKAILERHAQRLELRDREKAA